MDHLNLKVKQIAKTNEFGKSETVEFDGQTLYVGSGYGRVGADLTPDQFFALQGLVTNPEVVEFFNYLAEK